MEHIQSILRQAARRLGLITFFDRLHVTAIGVAALALILVVASKAAPGIHSLVNWAIFGPLLAFAAVGLAAALWAPKRPTPLHAAIEVDQRLDLREKLSTALLCHGREDAFAQAAIDDAIQVASRPQTREMLRRRFAVQPPGNWWIAPVILAAAFLAGAFMPNGDWFAREESQLAVADREQIREIREQYEQAIREAAEKLGRDPKDLKEKLGEGDEAVPGAEERMSPEEFQREAFKKLASLQDELRKEAQSEQARAIENLQQRMSQLNPAGEGPAADLGKALARSDFSAAQKALEQLQHQMAQGELAPEQKAALENLAEQLNRLAERNDQLQDRLRQAGIDPALARDPEALQQALDNARHLTPEEREQLAQMCQAAQQAGQMMQNMAGMCQAMGGMQGMQGMAGMEGMGGMAGAEGLGEQLSQLEMMAQQMGALNAALEGLAGQCQGMGEGLGMCQGGLSEGQGAGAMAQLQWLQMQTAGQGGAMGQRGIGAGGEAARQATRMNLVDSRENVHTNPDGPIIGSQFIEGQQILTGEARIRFAELVRAAQSRARQEVEENLLPVQYEAATTTYFGELERQAEVIGGDQ